jgi:hypothetical protein
MDRDATVLDGNPAGLQLAKPVADRRIERQRAHQAPKPAQLTSQVGGDDAFILAWGRSHAALRATQLQLAASILVNVALAAAVAFLAWRSEHKEPLVFVRDALGNVVQADAGSFLHAGDERNDPEIKGFLRRWVLDAYTWTPLDVEDRLKACLRVVDGKAQAVTKEGLRLVERQALVDRETSGRVYDDQTSGREPQVAITRRNPLEVMVSFDHYYIDRSGRATDAGHYFVRAILKQVPRSPVNPSGLMIADVQISQNL